jgi:hypothetical protein
MILGVRRALTGLAVGVVVALGAAPVVPAWADTPSPTPVTATTAATSEVTPSEAADTDTPDIAPDNSRSAWALGGAGVVALIAATVVFLRRR